MRKLLFLAFYKLCFYAIILLFGDSMKKYNYEGLNEDTHVFHLWEPLHFKVKENYAYISNSPLYNLVSNVLLIPVGLILIVFNKIMFGYRVIGREKIRDDDGFVSISNHIHPMDCTFAGLIYFPKGIYYPTLESNFNIPFIRHLIRILHAFPIPKDSKEKQRFYEQINKALNDNEIIHMYPEGSMWPYYDKVREFKYGAFKMAVNANVAIQPIRFIFVEPYGIYRLYKRKKCIHAVVLDPIYPNTELDFEEQIRDLRERAYNSINGD